MQEEPEYLPITQPHKFTGVVTFVSERTEYAIEIVVSNKDNPEVEYPNSYTFRASVKNGMADWIQNNVSVGDTVLVQFRCFGKEGTSKAGRYYHLNEFLVLKNGVTIVKKPERPAAQSEPDKPSAVAEEDLPF